MEGSKIIESCDSLGCKMLVRESVYEGQIIRHAPEFENIPQVLGDVQRLRTRQSDVWLLTYSKAGTHWMHEIIAVLLSNEPEVTPRKRLKGDSMLEHIDVTSLEKMTSPRILNSHMRLKYLPPADKMLKNKVICVVRNPKSVAVSYYHHTRGLQFYDYEGSFSGFLPTYTEGYHDLYGSWFDQVLECWDAFKDKDNVLFVFYEDLKKNTVKVIETIAKFLAVERNQTYYEKVAEVTSFDVMSKLKGKDEDVTKRLEEDSKTDFKFFRKGSIEDWKNHFTVAENEKFDAIYEEKMLKYPDLKTKIKFE